MLPRVRTVELALLATFAPLPTQRRALKRLAPLAADPPYADLSPTMAPEHRVGAACLLWASALGALAASLRDLEGEPAGGRPPQGQQSQQVGPGEAADACSHGAPLRAAFEVLAAEAERDAEGIARLVTQLVPAGARDASPPRRAPRAAKRAEADGGASPQPRAADGPAASRLPGVEVAETAGGPEAAGSGRPATRSSALARAEADALADACESEEYSDWEDDGLSDLST